MKPAATLRRIGSVNRPFTPDFDRHHIFSRWHMILSENRCPFFGIMR
jgi:hypothetical protein